MRALVLAHIHICSLVTVGWQLILQINIEVFRAYQEMK